METTTIYETRDALLYELEKIDINKDGQYFWKENDWDWSVKELEKQIRTWGVAAVIFKTITIAVALWTLSVPFFSKNPALTDISKSVYFFSVLTMLYSCSRRLEKFRQALVLVKILKGMEK